MATPVDLNTTIVALATALGSGSIAVIRVSGTNALAIGNSIFKGKDLERAAANTIHFGRIEYKGKELDQVMVSVFRQPHAYTGENSLEISCHANPIVIDMIIEALLDNGAVAAKPGEFTLRAFLNGKMDLTQAEAVSMLIAARTKHATKNALNHLEGALAANIGKVKNSLIEILSLLELDLDFNEENSAIIEAKEINKQLITAHEDLAQLINSFNYARIFNSGLHLTIIGKPNSGKSTLLNVLLGENRAITSHIPGTTRDTISEEIIIENILFKIVDTAGLRETRDNLEQEGVRRTRTQIDLADLILLLIDQSIKMNNEDKRIINTILEKYEKKILVVRNKSDKIRNQQCIDYIKSLHLPCVEISAKNEQHIDLLKKKIVAYFQQQYGRYEEELVITSRRQSEALSKTVQALHQARTAHEQGAGNELVAIDLREALQAIGEISGETATDDILNNIFAKFCIGK
jgi:tRNA modification GTPase